MNKFFKSLWVRLAALGLGIVMITGFTGTTSEEQYFEIAKNIDIFGKLYREVYLSYVDEVEPGKFMREGIDAMLESLDPFTQFISASEIEDFKFMNTGQYGGIGAVVTNVNNKVIVTEIYEGNPAQNAGLEAGDEIVKIDNLDVDGNKMDNLDIRNLLRGQPKTGVKITVKRPGSAGTQVIEVMRDDIKIKNVPIFKMVSKDVGYISLTGFTQNASGEVRQAFEQLKKENPEMKGLVLDLRGNPGGLLFEAIEVSNLFIPKGEKVVETRGRISGATKVYQAMNTPVDLDLPVCVLVNRGSASASEIVSGVLQDLDRGLILGQRSYGKGLVQNTRPLSYNAQVKITTAKYYTPSGRCIQAIDYTHRNEDGSVGKIPDSLMTSFKTKAGRVVYDGGGIKPDLVIERPDLHKITQDLLNKNIIFDFATQYKLDHPSMTQQPEEFVITDEIYQAFTDFCKKNTFTFETQTEKELGDLKKILEKESYNVEVENEMKALEAKLKEGKKDDLKDFKNEITPFLKAEIVSRYHFKIGRMRAGLSEDPELKSALALLSDKSKYASMLNGTIISDASKK